MPDTANAAIDLWLLQLEQNPVDALEQFRADFQRSESTRSIRLYQSIAFLVLFVATLAKTPAHEHAFRTHKFWNGSQRVINSKRLPLLAVRFVLGAKSAEGALYEQARSYAKVVEFFRENQADPYDVVNRLERRGIYGLLDELSDTEKNDRVAPSSSGDESDENRSSDDESGSDDSSDDGRGHQPTQTSSDDESEGEAGSVGSSDQTSDAVGSRGWWQAFLARCKEIYDSGNVPIVISGSWSDLEDLKRRSQQQSAKISVSQDKSADGWSHFACDSVERTGGYDNRGVRVIVQRSPPRLSASPWPGGV